MSEIKVVRLTGGPTSRNTLFELDGREMKGVRSVDIHSSVESVTVVTIQSIAREGVVFEGEVGKLNVHLHTAPGYEVHQTPREGGGWVWSVHKVEVPE